MEKVKTLIFPRPSSYQSNHISQIFLINTTMYFHPDVLTEVLLRLPVDSIVRFRCVSKEWNSLISSPTFISNQTHFAKPPSVLLLGKTDGCGSIPEAPDYKNFGIPMAASLKGLGVRLNGYCHGLVCLSSAFREDPIDDDDDDDVLNETILVWNPTLRIYLEVPEFGLKAPDYFSDNAGFGFDVRRNDYKVVRIPYPSSDDVPRRYEVFELSRNAWKIVTPNKCPPHLWGLFGVYFNGSAHWMSEKGTIVAFDFADEAFMEMSFPGELQNPSPDEVNILVKDGRYLSAVSFLVCPVSNNETICVWVMKEYGVEESWSMLFHIHDPVMGIPQELFCFRTNGLLLVTTDYSRLVSYDCSTNTETSVEAASRFEIVVELSETLALLQVPGTSQVNYKKQALDIKKV